MDRSIDQRYFFAANTFFHFFFDLDFSSFSVLLYQEIMWCGRIKREKGEQSDIHNFLSHNSTTFDSNFSQVLLGWVTTTKTTLLP
jgi:hypothetical protein